jgi:MerR family redox-sensitive transcriptional activator SoxR
MDAKRGIGEAAMTIGVAPSTLRYWEEQGLLDAVGRRGGRRVYDQGALDRLRLILLAQRAGFSIAEIRVLLRGFPPRASAGERWRALVGRKRREVGRKLEELRRMLEVLDALERCDCPDLDACGVALSELDLDQHLDRGVPGTHPEPVHSPREVLRQRLPVDRAVDRRGRRPEQLDR